MSTEADTASASHDAIATVVGLAAALRAVGVPATTDRVQQLVACLDRLDPSSREQMYWAGRLTLCSTPDDIRRYDRVFAAYFAGALPHVEERPSRPRRRRIERVTGAGDSAEGQEMQAEAETRELQASTHELLRHKDVTTLTPEERAELQRLLEAFWLPGQFRRTRRLAPARRGRLDPQRTVREMLQSAGEPSRLRYRDRRFRPRRVVLLLDVSGSMGAYADVLLRFAHAARRRVQAPTEVFTMGTRLTRVTREMGHREPDLALAAVSRAVPDWEGGTRLGEKLREFLHEWGQRGLARSSVVVVLSDGLERGDATLLGEQMARLSRLAFRVVWANPRKGHPGYAPLAAGMAAALPHVDAFCDGHSLAALERLAATVVGAVNAAQGPPLRARGAAPPPRPAQHGG